MFVGSVRATNKKVKTTHRDVVRDQFRQGFAPKDGTIPLRLVGTNEYINALARLDNLIELSSESELDVYDRILKQQPEFSIYARNTRGSTADSSDYGADSESGRASAAKGRRSSLSWLLALARIELASSMSMYSEQGNAFEILAPATYGGDAYFSLLQQDVSAHLNALGTDPDLREITRRSKEAESATLAYLRRFKLVSDMLQFLEQHGDASIQADTGAYMGELRRLGKKLERKVSMATVRGSLTSERSRSEVVDRESKKRIPGTWSSAQEITMVCQRILLRRLNAGAAERQRRTSEIIEQLDERGK